VADDKLGVWRQRDDVLSLPGPPFYRLGEGTDEKPLHARHGMAEPRPLRSLYVLSPVDAGARVGLCRLSPLKAIGELNRAFQAQLPWRFEQRVRGGTGMRERFHWWADLASRVAVYRLEVPRELSRLPEAYDAVMTEAEASRPHSC
jgi:hypothetical protein